MTQPPKDVRESLILLAEAVNGIWEHSSTPAKAMMTVIAFILTCRFLDIKLEQVLQLVRVFFPKP